MSIRKLMAVLAACGVAACSESVDAPTGPSATPEVAFAISGGGAGDWATAHNGTDASSSFLTITAPAVTKGDLLIAQITRSKDFTTTDAACAPSSEWTSLGVIHFEQKVRQEIFYHVATANAAATPYTWNFKTIASACGGPGSERTGTGATGGIIRYGGVDPWSPIAGYATQVSTGSMIPATAPTVNTIGPDARVLRLFSAFKSLTFNDLNSTRIYTAGSTNNSSERTAAAYQTVQANAGATGPYQVDMNTSAEWVSATLALTPAAFVTVNKVVVPAEDDGLFDLVINGDTHATDVGNGGTTGAIAVQTTGDVVVTEAAGEDTDLDDYVTTVSCDAGKGSSDGISHTFSVTAGDNVTCTITNTRKAELTITKVLAPTNDGGVFNLQVDGNTVLADAGHNGSILVKLAPGDYTVGETAGTNTNLGDYTGVISGGCATDGTITLAAGEIASCTITNTRKARLTVTKILSPTNDPGLFNLLVDGNTIKSDAGHNVSEVVSLVPGSYTVSEAAGTGTLLTNYTAVIGGACAANGTITLTAGQVATCTITNTRNAVGFQFYLYNRSTQPSTSTASSSNLPMSTTLPTNTGSLPNYDTNYDSFAGRLIKKDTESATQSDLTKYQNWITPAFAADYVINKATSAQVRIWTAMKDNDAGKVGLIRIYIRNCTAAVGSCTVVGQADYTRPAGAAFSEAVVTVPWTFAGTTHTVLSGRVLEVKVVVRTSSADDMWFGYDRQAMPARFSYQP